MISSSSTAHQTPYRNHRAIPSIMPAPKRRSSRNIDAAGKRCRRTTTEATRDARRTHAAGAARRPGCLVDEQSTGSVVHHVACTSQEENARRLAERRVVRIHRDMTSLLLERVASKSNWAYAILEQWRRNNFRTSDATTIDMKSIGGTILRTRLQSTQRLN